MQSINKFSYSLKQVAFFLGAPQSVLRPLWYFIVYTQVYRSEPGNYMTLKQYMDVDVTFRHGIDVAPMLFQSHVPIGEA